METIRNILLLFLGVVFAPVVAHAQVVISEVMYDLPQGSDTGREWVEVFNESAGAITLTEWKLFEANINHKITEFQGGGSLVSGGYAIIADNPAKFLLDWPGFSGLLFDSAFSLSNTGETLGIRDPDLFDTDTVTYSGESGAAGDGMTLTLLTSGTIAPASPTPGTGALIADQQPLIEEVVSTQNTTTTPTVSSSFPVEPQLYAFAGNDREVLVGADVVFEGKAVSRNGDILDGAAVRFVWNFGDGFTEESAVVAHHFSYPATYVVTLDVASGKNAASDRVLVTAREPLLQVSRSETGDVHITNGSAVEVDLSLWHLQVGKSFFSIPARTVILPHGSVVLQAQAIQLPLGEPILLYPNGVPVVSPPQLDVPAASPEVFKQSSGTGASVHSVIGTPLPSGSLEMPIELDSTIGLEQSAAAASFDHAASAELLPRAQSEQGMLPWVIGLIGVIGVGGIATAFALRTAPENPLEGWDIVEDTEVR